MVASEAVTRSALPGGDEYPRPGAAVLAPARSRRDAAGRPGHGSLTRAARVSDSNPNTPPGGLVGVMSGTVGVAGVAEAQSSLS